MLRSIVIFALGMLLYAGNLFAEEHSVPSGSKESESVAHGEGNTTGTKSGPLANQNAGAGMQVVDEDGKPLSFDKDGNIINPQEKAQDKANEKARYSTRDR